MSKKLFKLSVLCGAVSMISGSLFASELDTNAQVDSNHAAHVSNELKHEDNIFNIKLRNVYFDHTDKSDGSKDWSQWGQGVQFNITSPYYFADVLGFDTSYYITTPLSVDGANKHDDSKGGQILGHDNRAYHKLNLALLKAKYNHDAFNFNAKVGLIDSIGGLIAGSASRAAPASYRGVHADIEFDGAHVYASYIDGVRNRTNVGTNDFYAGDTKIDNVWQLGAKFNQFGINAEGAYLKSKAYKEIYGVKAGYTHHIDDSLSFMIDGNYQNISYDSALNDAITVDFDKEKKAYHYNINVGSEFQGISLSVGYGKTKAEHAKDLGKFNSDFANNSYGKDFTSIDPIIGNFLYNSQGVVALTAAIDLNKIPETQNTLLSGFNFKLAHLIGSGVQDLSDSDSKLDKETETMLTVAYNIDYGYLKGLSLKAVNSWHEKCMKGSSTSHEKQHQVRLYADYTIKF